MGIGLSSLYRKLEELEREGLTAGPAAGKSLAER
jgi:hypothetical protein